MGDTRVAEMSQARILKPFNGFEAKYSGLPVAENPIAIPGDLDELAGQPGYDPNLLAGIRVPLGAKVFVWLPRFFPQTWGGTDTSYRYRFVWRLRSLADQINSKKGDLVGHFGQNLPGVAQEGRTSGPPGLIAESAQLAGPRFVIPTAWESVQIVQNKFQVRDEGGTPIVVQKGTNDLVGVPINPQGQDPADVVVAQLRATSYVDTDSYQAPLSPKYPYVEAGVPPKVTSAGLLSQGFYPDAAGWASSIVTQNQGYSAGGVYVVYETEAKGDELIILIDREPGTDVNWDFTGVDANLSAVLGTAGNTRAAIPTLGIYVLTGTTTGAQAVFG